MVEETEGSPSAASPPNPWPWRLTLVLLLLFNAQNLLWLSLDTHVLQQDESSHFKKSAKYGFLMLESHRVTRVGRRPVKELETLYSKTPVLSYLVRAPVSGFAGTLSCCYGGCKHPPLVYILGAPWNHLAGSADAGTFFNTLLFSTLLVLSVYFIGARFSNPWGGFLSALLAVTAPLYAFIAHQFLLDGPMTAMCALTFAAFLKTEGFRHRRASVLFGLIFGLGMLTKETFPIFMTGIFLAWIVQAWRTGRRVEKTPAWANLGLAALTAFATAGFWYVPYAPGMIKVFFHHHEMGGIEQDPSWTTLPGALFYVFALSDQLSFWFSVALFPALAAFCLRLRRHPALPAFLLCVFLPLIFFTLHPNKDWRYTMPIIPLAAIVVGSRVASLRPRPIALAAAILVGAVALVQFTGFHWKLPELPPTRVLTIRGWSKYGPSRIRLFPFDIAPDPFVPSQAVKGLLAEAERERMSAEKAGRKKVVIKYLFNLAELTAPVDLHFRAMRVRAKYTGKGVNVDISAALLKPEEIDGADLVLLKEGGDQGMLFHPDIMTGAVEYFRQRRDRYVLSASYPHADGSILRVYRPKNGREERP
jgi:hypothetical protein